MLSLYIHIPFCSRKCFYCGFYSTPYSQQGSNIFIPALKTEALLYRSSFESRTFESVYIGGGTPTVLSLKELEQVLNISRRYFNIAGDAEYTVESNPNSLSADHLSLFRDHHVNRISLGVQSFDDNLLGFLGRSHTAEQAVNAFNLARTAGIENLSIDLIFGIPGQTAEQWQKDLDRVRSLAPDHVSVYSLSIDPGSRFGEQADRGGFELPDDESTAALYETACRELEQAGFEHYEISNFASPGFACRHNLNYWDRGEYLGIGPGAWSFIRNTRYRSVADVGEYGKRLLAGESAGEESERIDSGQAASEMVMLALRTSRGLDLEQYKRKFGAEAADRLMMRTEPMELSGLLKRDGRKIRLTRSGFLVSNEALNRLFL